MRTTFNVLRLLTERVPPRAGSHHSITLLDDSALMVSLRHGEDWTTFKLVPEDFDKTAEQIVEELLALWEHAKLPPPVDWEARTTTDGTPVGEHLEINPATGQQKAYVVLTPEERAKGFVRPIRQAYIHTKCGVLTRMGLALAETYAREPTFYSGTFCVGCKAHFPVGADGEFVWDGTDIKVGT